MPSFVMSPNITIADTGETCISTEWNRVIINMKIDGAEDTITAENGEETRPTKIVALPVTQHDKKVKEVRRLVWKSVTVTPHGSYNLFSEMKRMKEGCELFGDITKLGIKKVKKEVEFDIVIKTPKWELLCTYLRRKTEKPKEKALVNAENNKSKENPPKMKKTSITLAHKSFGYMGGY